MGTAVLPSQVSLHDRFHHEALTLNQHFTQRRNSNPVNTSPNQNSRNSRRRKRSPVALQATQGELSKSLRDDQSVVTKFPLRNLVMGEVKILKRGEKLIQANCSDSKALAKSDKGFNSGLGSTDRLGPDPATVQKQIRVSEFKVLDGVYAGSAFFSSPPPSSLPVPGFLGKNGAATSDLRRLLRINFI